MKFNKLFESRDVSTNEINYLWDYHPKSKGVQDGISKDLLLLKRLETKTPFTEHTLGKVNMFAGTFVKYFVRRLSLQSSDYLFCLVPSHKSNTNNENGINMFSRWCGVIRNNFDKDVIIRTIEIQSLHSGGDRDISVHLGSLKVNKNVMGKKVVVLDDITTTGNSLIACKKLLEDAGASEVIVFAFGKTISYY